MIGNIGLRFRIAHSPHIKRRTWYRFLNKTNTVIYLSIVMQAGFAFLEAGSVRSKNTTNILIKNTLDLCKFLCIYVRHLQRPEHGDYIILIIHLFGACPPNDISM
jgi:hypothetical protein